MATGPMLAGVGTDEDKQKLALDTEWCQIKIKQIEQQASKNTKEQSMLKQHKAVWMKELSHLTNLEKETLQMLTCTHGMLWKWRMLATYMMTLKPMGLG
ncbi:hypothetical protein EB796_003039 [Bugula neritina]|uniref:Uncharacterized protein n=1 Tax=Bugula neritina TaxID=10212 RepID=A0A7J7KKS7_BUGNE|nr:hypothetical protein EB796_003039 [Bugula neritina]